MRNAVSEEHILAKIFWSLCQSYRGLLSPFIAGFCEALLTILRVKDNVTQYNKQLRKKKKKCGFLTLL